MALVLSGCASRPHFEVPAPGGSIAYWIGGVGSPTVVLEASVGDDMSSWEPVLDSLAATTTTVAYSRGGYRHSELLDEESLGMRTGRDVATTLRSALERMGAEPPFVLVGHSIGGLYALAFAGLYPDEVAGLLLIDARLPDFAPTCYDEGVPPCDPPTALVVAAPVHVRAELLGLADTELSVPAPSQLGGLPVTLVASEHSDIDELRLGHSVLVRTQRSFAQALPSGRFVVAEGSGHYVHEERADLIIDEVRRLVAEARSGARR